MSARRLTAFFTRGGALACLWLAACGGAANDPQPDSSPTPSIDAREPDAVPEPDALPDAGAPDSRPDSDGDGFLDADDPAPFDINVPGDFSTPEAILANPTITMALAAVAQAHVSLPTHAERQPRNISGFYSRAQGAGRGIASGDGTGVGDLLVAAELRLTSHADLSVDSASVAIANGTRTGFSISGGQILRGTESEITIYGRSKSRCTEAGSNFSYWTISIDTETVNVVTGNFENEVAVVVNVYTQGTLTPACAARLGGNLETVGGWLAIATSLTSKIAVEQLRFMCVSERNAYVPTETWTSTSGATCQCTLSYTVSCTN